MLLPSSCLRFGPIRTQNLTVGTSQYQDQADKQNELKKWVRQQREDLKKMYSDEVEIVPSPMLLQEMEEAEGRQPTPVCPVSIPGQICSSLPPTVSATPASSRRRRHHHKPSSSPTVTAAASE
ncbi:hypothetical protein ILYODFUR_031788 [Ilyodon furcidens]|uniref:Uncharacterized protein n=1 Tax=Ilyodon furcidens TaxID=33524 RepID=A0ABV0SRU6_9TELE